MCRAFPGLHWNGRIRSLASGWTDMNLELSDKTALVTGASRGIGRAVALGLAREGARLVIAARRVNLLEELARDIVSARAPEPLIIEMDLYQEGSAGQAGGGRAHGPGPCRYPRERRWRQPALSLRGHKGTMGGSDAGEFRAAARAYARGDPGDDRGRAGGASSTSPAAPSRAASTRRTRPRPPSTPGPRVSRARWRSTASRSTRYSRAAS